MYWKTYARNRVENEESWKDIYREEYLYPYLQRFFSAKDAVQRILDIGCGRWKLLQFIDSGSSYTWVDVNKHFFEYIYEKYPRKNIVLEEASLPNISDAISNQFELVVCCQVLHQVSNLEESIEDIFRMIEKWWEFLLITFREDAKDHLRNSFKQVISSEENYVKGIYSLGSWVDVEAEINFHKEDDIEKFLWTCWNYKKEYVWEMFVAYEWKSFI